MSKRPFIQLYTGDWLSDGKLRMCAASTRGVWADTLCAMHREGERGYLTGTLEQLSRLANCSDADFNQALDELADTATATVIDHSRVLNGSSYEVVDNSVEKPLNELCPSLPAEKSPTFLALCPGKFTVINRRMAREYILRENTRLRKKRQRGAG